MIKLDETNYIDLSLDKVTLEQRKEILKAIKYERIADDTRYCLVFYDRYWHDMNSYSSREDDCRQRWKSFDVLRNRKETFIKSLGGM